MHLLGYSCLWTALLLCVFLAGRGVFLAWKDKPVRLVWFEGSHQVIFFLLVICCVILAYALWVRDYSYLYVLDYTDNQLPWYYALTAFWAGQKGSFLLWSLFLSLFAFLFSWSPSYRQFSESVRLRFWIFFLLIQGFFLSILTTVGNPFQQVVPVATDGSGLNPLLQHPGMIFHPPLLFLGYAGFTIPACLALAASLDANPRALAWLEPSRHWVLIAWVFLTAGIVLGAWWSYMELGWGGYWAWDPVENASLIPWLSSTAFIHTSIIGRRDRSLLKTNVSLIGLTLVLCLFATFLTRSGVLQSLHAFGSAGVGKPLLYFILFGLLLIILVVFSLRQRSVNSLSDLISQQGFMVLLTWLLLVLALVIISGTMWPVLSGIWSESSVGMGQGYYNRVCLPFFALILVFLASCPWLGWRSWGKNSKILIGLLAFFILLTSILWIWGLNKPLAIVSISLALTSCLCILLLYFLNKGVRRNRKRWAAYAVHLGVGLLALGVAFSGPYKQEKDAVLKKGETIRLGEYVFTYKDFKTYSTSNMDAYQAQLAVKKNDHLLGKLLPERRMYRNFDRPFAEASVIPGLGDELYATLLGFNEQEQIQIQISINPLINWIWIGAVVMCLGGFLTLARTRSGQEKSESDK